jgi:hypothetical protein
MGSIRAETGSLRPRESAFSRCQLYVAFVVGSRDWTMRARSRDVKFTKAKPKEDGSMPPLDLFGYQNHVSIDCGFGFIRKWAATDAAAYEGRRL